MGKHNNKKYILLFLFFKAEGYCSLEDLLLELQKFPLANVKAVLFRFTVNDTEEKSKLAKLLEEYYGKHQIQIQVFGCSWNSIYLSSLLLACVAEHGEKSFPNQTFCLIVCQDDNTITSIDAITSKNLPSSQFLDYVHIISTSGIPFNRLKEDLLSNIKATDVYIKKSKNVKIMYE